MNQQSPRADEDPRSAGASGRRPRGLVIAAVAVPMVGIALLAVAYERLGTAETSRSGPPAADFAAVPARQDRPAPDLRLPDLQGAGSVSLRSLAGSVVVLNIWASWCPPCREEAQGLEQGWTRYRSRGVQFVGVDHEDTRGAGMAFVRRFGVTYPSGFDPDGTVAARYGAVGIPTTVVIDRRGRIVYQFLGKTTAPSLAAILDRVLGSG